jgi:hypothetical protein
MIAELAVLLHCPIRELLELDDRDLATLVDVVGKRRR